MRPRRTPEFSQNHMQRPRSGRLNHAKKMTWHLSCLFSEWRLSDTIALCQLKGLKRDLCISSGVGNPGPRSESWVIGPKGNK